MSSKRRVSPLTVILYAVMVILTIILLFPFFYMISKSLMTSEEVIQPIPQFLPKKPQFVNYISLFSTNDYLKGLLNTLLVVCWNMFFVPLSAGIIAFSFAKLEWKGRRLMFALMLGTMVLAGAITHVPLYSL